MLKKIIIGIILVLFSIFYITHSNEASKSIIGKTVKNHHYISWEKLKEKGITSAEEFYVMGFDYTEEYVLGRLQIIDAKLISQGKPRAVTVIPISNPENIKNIYVPLQSIEQYIPYNQEEIILLGNGGNAAGILNIKTEKFSYIIKNSPNKAGFKFSNFYTLKDNKIFVKGYKFDKDQVAEDQNDYWFEFNPTQKNLESIGEKITNATEIIRKLGKVRMFYWVDPYTAAFTRTDTNPTEIWVYHNNRLYKVDTQEFILEISLSQNNDLLYIYKKGDNSYLTVYNLDTKDRVSIPSNGFPFLYPFISDDGNVIVVASMNILNKNMYFWIGYKKDKYSLQYLIEKAKIGSFKLSKSGRKFTLLNEDGLLIGELNP